MPGLFKDKRGMVLRKAARVLNKDEQAIEAMLTANEALNKVLAKKIYLLIDLLEQDKKRGRLNEQKHYNEIMPELRNLVQATQDSNLGQLEKSCNSLKSLCSYRPAIKKSWAPIGATIGATIGAILLGGLMVSLTIGSGGLFLPIILGFYAAVIGGSVGGLIGLFSSKCSDANILNDIGENAKKHVEKYAGTMFKAADGERLDGASNNIQQSDPVPKSS